MAIFEKAYDITMSHEGGYVNDPDDAGGETYCGVSRKNFPNWQGWEYIDQVKRTRDIKTNEVLNHDTLKAMVKLFYKAEFWDYHNLDSFEFQEIANEIFDTGINMGRVIGARFLQKALNLLNKNEQKFDDLKIDGKIGSKTLRCFQYVNYRTVLKVMNGLQFNKYVELCEKNPVYEKFFYGWLNRT
jgi:lysozyme family protein